MKLTVNRTRCMTRIILATMLAALLPMAVHAQYVNTNFTVLDINFDTDTNGSPPVVVSPMGPPFPATHPQAFGYFPPVGAPIFTETNGITFTVGDIAGMTKAVIMSNSAAATASSTHVSFIDHNFSVPTVSRSILEFDFSQIETPAGTNGGFRSDWLIVAFKVNSTPSQVAYAIGTKHGFPGQIFLQQTFPNSLAIGTYTNGEPTHVELITYNEGNGRFDVYLNGQLAAHDVPFNNPMLNAADQVKELFIQQIAASNSVNVVAYDNFQYSLMIPEPSSVVMASLGIVGLTVSFMRHRFRR